MNELISQTVFNWLLVLAVGVVSAWWFVHDLVFLARIRGADGADPLIRDQRFGYTMGLVMATIGVVGTLIFMHHTGVI